MFLWWLKMSFTKVIDLGKNPENVRMTLRLSLFNELLLLPQLLMLLCATVIINVLSTVNAEAAHLLLN